ncbi:SAM-dependent methyltransferase [Actinocorallia populi]|uniref:SAM-dependent methyltransferase n=1 Tax=Actinocorallia populi TaxID=2079200 RepID=UPI000D0949E3|nr:SAM-dependent methyltransferase [Actinocorallia populi]
MTDRANTLPAQPEPAPSDASVPSSARMWNYWIGGEHYHPVDKEAADAAAELYPEVPRIARTARLFLGRAVTHLAGEAGVRQFLDLGSGLPVDDNVHEIAQRVAPASRVVYVDNEPLVLEHSAALLASRPEGRCGYVDSDVRNVEHILERAAEVLDLTRPVAVLMLGILGNIADDAEAASIVARFTADLVPGSHLVVNDGIDTPERVAAAARHNARHAESAYHNRSPQQIASFFTGLELLEPGLVPTSRWRPGTAPDQIEEIGSVCGVAVKRQRTG